MQGVNFLRTLLSVFPLFGLLTLSTSCRSMGKPEALPDSPVRITELHYHPSREQGEAEFIEITNVSDKKVDLSGWSVTGAKPVKLPQGTMLEPGESLVVCAHEGTIRRLWGKNVKVAGEFQGKLKNSGETVRILDPKGGVADEAVYSDSVEGLTKADGGGFSLHRKVFDSETTSWVAGEPTPGIYSQETR